MAYQGYCRKKNENISAKKKNKPRCFEIKLKYFLERKFGNYEIQKSSFHSLGLRKIPSVFSRKFLSSISRCLSFSKYFLKNFGESKYFFCVWKFTLFFFLWTMTLLHHHTFQELIQMQWTHSWKLLTEFIHLEFSFYNKICQEMQISPQDSGRKTASVRVKSTSPDWTSVRTCSIWQIYQRKKKKKGEQKLTFSHGDARSEIYYSDWLVKKAALKGILQSF